MKLCIAEKPSVAKDIAKIIGANSSKDGYYEGNGYQVTWTFGHLCELQTPEFYNPVFKRWSLRHLPIVPEKFKIKIKNDTGVKKQFDIIKDLISNADEVINCGDAGQEGELIQRWVMQLAGVKCPVKRLWISSLTKEAILNGFENLKPSEQFDNLYKSGMSRAVGDWLLGINASRYFTLRNGVSGEVFSVGRVQTPTLAMIVNRDEEIENFVSEKYYTLSTVYKGYKFVNSSKYENKQRCQYELDNIKDCDFNVTKITKTNKKENPPKLFDLTSLQVHCNNSYSMSAEETLNVIQSLYEKKLTTYPRVDTTYLTNDMYKQCYQILNDIVGYDDYILPLDLNNKSLKKRKYVFDDSKVTDHHAIIPTGKVAMNLNSKETIVYDDIVKRFICVFHDDCEYSENVVTGTAGDVTFKATGKLIEKTGFYDVLGNPPSDAVLPEFATGESGPHKPKVEEHSTTPPARFTEATLLRAMETAGKYVDDRELKDIMKENGIGRPSTRANIIEVLIKRGYIRRDKKKLVSTALGRKLISQISDETLKSPALTGEWERKLNKIERGEYDYIEFVNELKKYLNNIFNTQ